jgi:hypothetical protein
MTDNGFENPFDEIRYDIDGRIVVTDDQKFWLEFLLDTVAKAEDAYHRGDVRESVMKTWIAGSCAVMLERVTLHAATREEIPKAIARARGESARIAAKAVPETELQAVLGPKDVVKLAAV